MSATMEGTPESVLIVVREDLGMRTDSSRSDENSEVIRVDGPELPKNRDEFLSRFDLPTDSVVKLNYEGKFIPWSLIPYCCAQGTVKIHVLRPHQTIKPRLQGDDMLNGASEALVREKVRRLECRVASLETEMDETLLQTKTERDLQLLTKQIAFLGKRLDEADHAEWIKKERN